MRPSKGGFRVLVGLSILFALFVAIFPLPSTLSLLRPEIMCLVAIYFITVSPQEFGILFAWMLGLVMDIFEGTAWGAHALALTIVAYICVTAHQRIRNYSVWHQTLWVFVMVGIHQVIVNWIQGLAGYDVAAPMILMSAGLTALLWPPVYVFLSSIRLRYRLA